MLIENLAEYSLGKRGNVILPSECPVRQSKSGIKLINFSSGKLLTDVLHSNSIQINCSKTSCTGSLMSGQSRTPKERSKEDTLKEAVEFQEQYFASVKEAHTEDICQRIKQISQEISRTGTYELTYDELCYGTKLAWRNASRCIGRIQWNKLHLMDARSATCTKDMFEALCRHLEYATNDGNIRSTITLFPQRFEGREDFRVWNPQLINFAGYLQPDGTVVGDPARVQFTRACQRLGWKGKGGRFDILPWVVSAPGEGAKFYDIPEHLVLMVNLEHPKFPWFKELGLKWYAVPAVSEMMLDIGGVSFPAAPFNGWYMATEIGARNLCDSQRYNFCKEVAEKMGLDTMTPTSLWKDITLVETTLAVLHSFQKNKVTIVDHHTAADTFMKHMETEQNLRGGCPADWVWIVPPISGSSTPVFHQEMINYNLKPSYEYQEKAWITYQWPQNNKIKLKYSFRSIAKVVRICVSMMSKSRSGRVQATILYASETGKSETFARKLGNMIHASFNTKVLCMDDYSTALTSEDFVIVVASTFGSGEPPDNGKRFYRHLKKMKERKTSLKSLKYAVFALGSSQYPNFCQFGINVDQLFSDLGATRVMALEQGDELGGQEHTFNTWLPSIYKNACKDFNIELRDDMVLPVLDNTWKKGHFRIVPSNYKTKDVLSELSKLHNKKLFPVRVLSKANLQSAESERQTLQVRLDTKESPLAVYEPGDHIAIFPSNPIKHVNIVLKNLRKSGIKPNDVVQLESLKGDSWNRFERLPPASFKSYLTHYLDITSPPTCSFLHLLSEMAKDAFDKYRLKRLSEVTDDYEEWKAFKYPSLPEILDEFPSIELDPTLLISELPLLQPRYYSCSSSRLVSPAEIHLTYTLVSYRTRDNRGPIHFGVCTSYLSSIPREEIPCFIRSAPRFRLPEDPQKPVLMIGAGSGIAPFRSFWQERDALSKKLGSTLGPMYLFFGCRQSAHDNLYHEERTSMLERGILTRVFTALSREPGQPKKYVQVKLEEESQIVLDVLSNDGHVYVCGDAVMATDVRATISRILINSKEDMDIDLLVDSGKYHEDVFGVLHKK